MYLCYLKNNYTNDIRYGRKDFNGFTLPEHAGICKRGAPLIGASIVISYARRSLTTGGNAESSEGQSKSTEICKSYKPIILCLKHAET